MKGFINCILYYDCRFPLVTAAELAIVDNTCIICREDMTVQVRKY